MRNECLTVSEIKELEESVDDSEYISLESVEDILDDIESELDDILYELSYITGLTEIDDICKNLKNIVEKLY